MNEIDGAALLVILLGLCIGVIVLMLGIATGALLVVATFVATLGVI